MATLGNDGILYVNDVEYHRITSVMPLMAGSTSIDIATRVLPMLFPHMATEEIAERRVCWIVNTDDR